MVVLPRNRRYQYQRGGAPPPPPHYASHPDGAPPPPHHHPHNAPRSSRFMNQQSIILLLAGMGIGYLVLPVLVVNNQNTNQGYYNTANRSGGSSSSVIGLNHVVENLERQRMRDNGIANVNSGNSLGGGIMTNGGEGASPMNMMHSSQQNAAAAMLRRGDLDGIDNRRRASDSPDEADVMALDMMPDAVDAADASQDENHPDATDFHQEDPATIDAPVPALAINKMPQQSQNQQQHTTFQDQEEEEPNYSEVEKRFVESQKLLATQSIPTSTNPHVMKTPNVPDSQRKKILISGGAGFVGSHLVDKLMMEGHEVIVIDNFFTGQRKNIEHWMHHPRFSLVVHDITEPIMLEVDEIYHLACPASPPHYQYNPVKTIKTSTMGTLNMLGLAKRIKAKILLTSTSEIYGDPKVHPQPESYWGNVNTIGPRSCYDEGKRVAETMMYSYRNQNQVDVRVARIFNTFGPRMHPNDGRVVSNFIIQSLQDKPLTIYGDGSQTRSFQYVSDLVDGLHALMNGNYDMPVNLGNPDEYTVKHFAEYIKEITGSGSEISFLKATQDDPTQRKPDISTAKRELNWAPRVTVKEGLQKTIAYFSRVLDESGEIIPTGQEASRPKPKIHEES